MNISEEFDLKKLNINLDKIEYLRVYNMNSILRQYFTEIPNPNSINEILSFFSPKNILEKLYRSSIDTRFSSLDKINSFKSLKVLHLLSIDFDKIFTLRLNDLKMLSISLCNNFAFDETKIFNLEELTLEQQKEGIIKPNSLLNFPKLKCFKLKSEKILGKVILSSSLKNLKELSIIPTEFLKLEISSLDKITILESNTTSAEIEKQMLEKLLSLKNIKFIEIGEKLHDEIISTIEKENIFVESLKANNNYLKLIEKFPNLSEINYNCFDKNNFLEIRENNNFKIRNIQLIGIPKGIIYCQSFEKLISLTLSLNEELKDLNKVFPIFNEKCTIVFKSLTTFRVSSGYFKKLEYLTNCINNLDSFPNIKILSIFYKSKEITKKIYFNYIQKIFSRKLNVIILNIDYDDYLSNKNYYVNDYYYTKNELKKIFPNTNFLSYDVIMIKKIYQ